MTIKRAYRKIKSMTVDPLQRQIWGREAIDRKNRKRLENHDFSIVSSNCNGGVICHDLGEQFRSPFVNLWMQPTEYIKLLNNLKEYMNEDLAEIKEEGINYPIGILKDVRVYFQHYKSFDEAKKKWEERKRRINYDKLYILFCDRDNCTEKDIENFDSLPYEHKVCFTHIPMNYHSTFCIRGFENDDTVGVLTDYEKANLKVRYIDKFDYVSWLNN